MLNRSRLLLLAVTAVSLAACSTSSSSADVAVQPDATSSQDVAADDVQEVESQDTVQPFEPVPPHVEQIGHFTVVWLAGTAYEMGYQQGELLHDTIAKAIDFVESDLTLAAIPLIAKDMGIIDIALANSYPDIIDECQGMIDAAGDTGFNMDYCLVLNFGDVMLEMVANGVPGPGCSSLIARGAATPDGRVRHARNLDWGSMNIEIIHQHPVVFVRQPSDGIPHVYIGFPLNLSPYTGMNLAGVAMGSHEADPAGPGEQALVGRSHVQMLGQALKRAHSLDEVREFVQSQEHMSAEIFSVSDGDNDTGAIFEMTASAIAERSLEADIAYATNHFLAPSMQDKHAKPSSGSLNRVIRFQQLAAQGGAESKYGALDEGTIADIMRDPINPAVGEAEPDELLEAKGWDNDGSLGANGPMHFVVFDPANRLFYVDAGILPLHKQPYHCFSLEELLGLPDATPCPVAELP